MGKLKISKNKKSRSSKGTSGIPNWLLSIIIIIVTLAVVAVCVCTAIFSSGVIGRNSLAMGIDDIKVNQNMMAYFFRVNYMNDLSNLENTLYYYELYGIDSSALGYSYPDTTKSLKDQPYHGVAGSDTWYNTILASTKEQVAEYLMFAAAAKKAGVALNDTDQAAVDSELDNVIASIRSSTGATSYTADACCELAFGEGVTAEDIRDALELQALATKMYAHLSETITAAVKGDDTRIDEQYNKTPNKFSYVDYYAFSFDVHYTDVITEKYGSDKKESDLTEAEKAEVLALYKEKIEKARANAEALSGKNTLIDFKEMITEFSTNEEYADIYNKQVEDLKSEDLPSEENIAIIKNTLIAKVIEEIANGEPEAINDVRSSKPEGATDSADYTYTIYDIQISQKFSDAIKATKNNLFASVVTILDTADVERAAYYESSEGAADDKISVWAFDSTRVTGEKKIFESGDGADDTKIDDLKSKNFSAQVIVLVKTPYKDLTRSRDFAYLLYTSETAAKAALTELEKIEGLDEDKFLALASSESNPASAYQSMKDYPVGAMGSEDFDEWLFSANTKPGSYTKEAIKMNDGSYMVALYVKQNTTPEWKTLVIDYLANEDYTKATQDITNEFQNKIAASPSVMDGLKDSAYVY